MEYIATHHVFTTDGVRGTSASSASAETALRRAVRGGSAERVRRGLYVSRTGPYRDVSPDPFSIVMAADADAVVSYHAALVAHGVAHNASFECAFRSSKVRTPFAYASVRYVPYPQEGTVAVQLLHGDAFGSARVTTKEQTLVDCLGHPGRAGGIEEAVRSLSAFPYIDPEALEILLGGAGPALCARVGWLLEREQGKWRVGNGLLARLEERAAHGPSRLDPGIREARGWSPRWRLSLPAVAEEVETWTA